MQSMIGLRRCIQVRLLDRLLRLEFFIAFILCNKNLLPLTNHHAIPIEPFFIDFFKIAFLSE